MEQMKKAMGNVEREKASIEAEMLQMKQKVEKTVKKYDII